MLAVEATGVEVRYGNVVAVSGVNLCVPTGSMVALLGPNGAGKSTLIKVLAGLVVPSAGKATVLETIPRRSRGKIAYLPQREDIYWDYPLAVWDIVAMGRIRAIGQLRSVPRSDEQVWKALHLVGISGLADKCLKELSGGQQQRAFLARAISTGGEIFLLDEPIAGLDASAEESLFEVFFSLGRMGKTIIMSTHDISSTIESCDLVMIMKGQPVAFGPPTEVLTVSTLEKAYGSSRVAMHLQDIKGAARWT